MKEENIDKPIKKTADRPSVRPHKQPTHIEEYPMGTCFPSGYLVTKNSGWRTFKPVVNPDACTNCLRCYLLCPDGVIFKSGQTVAIDYDFCKGCGICAHECKKNAIVMVKEEV